MDQLNKRLDKAEETTDRLGDRYEEIAKSIAQIKRRKIPKEAEETRERKEPTSIQYENQEERIKRMREKQNLRR